MTAGCPAVACDRVCGPDDCKCAPCACPRCLARAELARRTTTQDRRPDRGGLVEQLDLLNEAA